MNKQDLIARIKANFPQEMQALDQWVTWRLESPPGKEKPTKVPYNAKTWHKAESNDPSTWSSFEVACNTYLKGNFSGVGFMFSEFDPYVGVDFDKCIVDGAIDPKRAAWMHSLDSYSEVSQSGTGVHIIAKGALPEGRRKHDRLGVEMYDRVRFFVVTGNHIPGTPKAANERTEQLATLHREVFPIAHRMPTATVTSTPSANIPQDDQVLLRRMFSASNGAKIEALWNGDQAGYESQSSADMALCSYLAFWTGNDKKRIDRLFKQSALYRDKWERNARQGETYGSGTIDRALVSNPYQGSKRRRVMVTVKVSVA